MVSVRSLRDTACHRLASKPLVEAGFSTDEEHRAWIERDVDFLLADLLRISRAELLLRLNAAVTRDEALLFNQRLERLREGEPLAYILGWEEFYGRRFAVSPAVLIPRPETELLVEKALSFVSQKWSAFQVVDVGVGSGAILLSLAAEIRERWGDEFTARGTFIGIDRSRDALRIAAENIRRFNLQNFAALVAGDLLDPVTPHEIASPSILTANLPYIADADKLPYSVEHFEPRLALRGGVDGLDVIRRCIDQLSIWGSTCSVIFEVGEDQAHSVRAMLEQHRFSRLEIVRDLRGVERFVVGRRDCA